MALTDNLLSYWKLDESSGNAADSVGSNTLTNSNVTYSAGKINNGAVFNGSNARFTKSSISQADGFSISAWIKWGVLDGQPAILFRKASDGSNWAITTTNDGGNEQFKIQAYNGSSTTIVGSANISTATWYHVVAIFNGASSKLYMNGVSVGTGTLNTGPSAADNIYFANDSGGNWATVSIDEVGWWTRALTSGEVTTLYNGGTGLQYPFIPPEQPPVLDTLATTDITHVAATLNGEITDVGLEDADERGFVWGTTSHSDPGDTAPASTSYTEYETETGTFSAGTFDADIADLSPETTYYVRAYAHNSDGYAYGDEVSFDTDAAPPFRFTNLPGIVFDEEDTTTIYAERLNDILDRLDALEG